jgi:hypothetical protein
LDKAVVSKRAVAEAKAIFDSFMFYPLFSLFRHYLIVFITNEKFSKLKPKN